MTMRLLAIKLVVFIMVVHNWHASQATMDVYQVRSFAAKYNITCLLVFGDSSVDPGNNDYFLTSIKSNYPPYGEDFAGGNATGRFCNGRLTTDFVAEAVGYTKVIKGFLDPKITNMDILHGVSFASASSGYDDYTANLSSVLQISKQLDYFKHYMIHLRQLVGKDRAQKIINNAVVILSMGTNDFLQNYFIEPLRSEQYNVEQYEDFLISCFHNAIKGMHSLGVRRLVVVGVPPFGCMPIVRTLRGETNCDNALNKLAFSFNAKLHGNLTALGRSLGMTTTFADIYRVMMDAIQNPSKYGFVETLKGCCGSGTYEYGDTCRNMKTCADRSKYVFWDAVHPTERMYEIIAEELVASIVTRMFK